ncbi:MAG: DUF2254 domain-containing protein [Salinisphaera sp.]|jgi:uncharacterized membrane protein|nr:DUF2254 domain-containing protein [Salinisphaera sp.]
MAQLVKLWNHLSGSYWFIPTVMSLISAVLALVLSTVDNTIGEQWVKNVPLVYQVQAEGARGLLTTVAGSMIGVAGVTFSITIAALAYTTSTLGPRLLTKFMNDTGNQITLGTFVSTFVYCLLLLRTIRTSHETVGAFVPHLGILVAVLFAVASLAVLIYFIHHITESLHVSNVVGDVGCDLAQAIELCDQRSREKDNQPVAWLPADFSETAVGIRADNEGYIQNLLYTSLVNQAVRHDLVLRIERAPGDFVGREQVLLWAWPAERVSDEVAKGLRNVYALGRQRTESQDLLFLVNELVEIAARALSSGINDPYTAMSSLDWLTAALHRLARRRTLSMNRFDKHGQLRLWAVDLDFQTLGSAIFDQLRAYFATDYNASLHMLQCIGETGEFIHRVEQRQFMLDQAGALQEAALKAMTSQRDRQAITHAYLRACRQLAAHERTPQIGSA